MQETTIKLRGETKMELDSFREYMNESYDELLRKLIFIAKNCKKNPELSSKTVQEIEDARKRIKSGSFYSENELKKRLGF
ncbi:MAG: hypothetical protein PHG04_04070 [Candidatus Nanoarchaeia archaeon]|nr:hypothetical protein [Candidatus Nanoarchaeia archaeon]MDD5054522.1 hypothetical protein [Candidatus Nanoarchaeia archaeon]